MDKELKFIKGENSKYTNYYNSKKDIFGQYPIGILGDIEIHFQHYKDESEAKIKWDRRKKRINYQNCLIKCDGSFATEEIINEFVKLEYRKKVIFTSEYYPYSSCLKLYEKDKFDFYTFIENYSLIKLINKWNIYLDSLNNHQKRKII
jgi:uncharacterized protein (DUF1919 family)